MRHKHTQRTRLTYLSAHWHRSLLTHQDKNQVFTEDILKKKKEKLSEA